MEFTSVPTILIFCYIVGEIYKFIFKNKQENYKLIPVIVALTGGVLGILIYFTAPEIMFNASNVWVALTIGVVSGFSSTGANQVVKQLIGGK